MEIIEDRRFQVPGIQGHDHPSDVFDEPRGFTVLFRSLRRVIDGNKARPHLVKKGGHLRMLTEHVDNAVARTTKMIRALGLEDFCAAVVNFDVPPDYASLLDGKEDTVFPKMKAACEEAMAAGADVVCLGSTTMHQAAEYLAETLPIPVVNPGPLTYKLVESVLDLKLTHSRKAYPKPLDPYPDMIHAMLKAGKEWLE